jgi:hypothetical protein
MTAKPLTLNSATGFILTVAIFTIASGTLFGSDASDVLNDAAQGLPVKS